MTFSLGLSGKRKNVSIHSWLFFSVLFFFPPTPPVDSIKYMHIISNGPRSSLIFIKILQVHPRYYTELGIQNPNIAGTIWQKPANPPSYSSSGLVFPCRTCWQLHLTSPERFNGQEPQWGLVLHNLITLTKQTTVHLLAHH